MMSPPLLRAVTLGPVAAIALAALSSSPALAQSAASFKGRTMTIVVGFGPGGGYDIYGRLVAAHFGNHLPGKPTVLVQNTPGAASVKAANILYNSAPKDGTSLGLFLSALTVNAVLQGNQKYQPEKFSWIGRVNDSATLGVVWSTAPATSIPQATGHEIVLASTGASGNSAMVPWALNSLIGTRFKVVTGYTSTAAAALAMEQGEVQGIGAVSYEYLGTVKADWLKSGKVKVMYSIDLKRKKALPDVPAVVEFAKDAKSRQVLSLLGSASAIGYSFAAPPGVSRDVVGTLSAAFAAMLKDPAFLADAEKRKLDVDPLTGEEVQKIVADAVATPQAVVELARKATAKPL